MKYLRFMLVTVVAVWLDVSFLGAWRPMGVIPDLFLIVLLVAAMSKARASEVVVMAIAGGVLFDFASGIDFGLKTAFFCFLVLLVVLMKRTGADFEGLSMKLAAVISATILYDAVILIPILLSLKGSMVWSAVLVRIVWQLLLNVAILAALYWPLRWVYEIGAASPAIINRKNA